MRNLGLAAVLYMALMGGALGQTSPVAPDEDVIVHPPNEDNARAFVHDITATPTSYWQAPLWHASICYKILGLSEESAAPLLERMRNNSQGLGLRVSGPRCHENVLVAVTNDVSAVITAAERTRLRGMALDRDHGVSMGHAAWRDFVETPRPVRWWHVSELVTRDDRPVETAGSVTKNNSSGDAIGGATVADSGYIHQPTHLNLHHILIIVDAGRVNGISTNALADYLTMVSLAPIDPNADVSNTPTILALFSNVGVTEMTDWDRAYLRGLYAANPNTSHSAQQERDIAHRMRH